jgi:hypothetical protein
MEKYPVLSGRSMAWGDWCACSLPHGLGGRRDLGAVGAVGAVVSWSVAVRSDSLVPRVMPLEQNMERLRARVCVCVCVCVLGNEVVWAVVSLDVRRFCGHCCGVCEWQDLVPVG